MSKLRILVVDDDEDFAASLGHVFERRGHEVQLAFSGEEAVEASGAVDFDIAFVDLKMPDKDGLQSFQEIRALRPDARVVMISGYTSDPRLPQAVDQGALGVLYKPVDPRKALDLVQEVVC